MKFLLHSPSSLLAATLILSFLTACSNQNSQKLSDSVSRADSPSIDSSLVDKQNYDDFLASDDIAMTIRSIADAINYGEKLDSTEYNFHGILTDGQGAPIYTDNQNRPGSWNIEITSPQKAIIYTCSSGNLPAAALIDYISEVLDLDDSNIISSEGNPDKGEASVVYSFDKSYITFLIGGKGRRPQLMTIEISPQMPKKGL